jgi:hypothetical protein
MECDSLTYLIKKPLDEVFGPFMISLDNPERIDPKEVKITGKIFLSPFSWNVLCYRVK